MANIRLTQNFMFFKVQEEKNGYERQVKEAVQDFNNEMAAVLDGRQTREGAAIRAEEIQMKAFEATFRLTELNIEATYTPYRLGGA